VKISTKIFIAFSIILVLSVLNTVSNFLLSEKVEVNADFLSSSQEIIRNSGQFQRSILEMQSSFRGYLLSQDSSFLSGYDRGIHEVPQIILTLKMLVKNDPFQNQLLDTITNLHAQWITYSRDVINANRLKSEASSSSEYSILFESAFKGKIGKLLYDKIAANFVSLNTIEYRTRELHARNLANSIVLTQFFSWLFIGLIIGIGTITLVYVIRSISRRIRLMVNLAESISKGNFTIIQDDYNDELTSLSLSMNVMSYNLEKTIAQLEYRNMELDKFAYVVSHDLKAPLRGIYNVIKWIQEDVGNELSDKLNEFIQIISKRTVRMELLINGLLDYARLRTKAKLELTNVHEMVTEIITDIVPNTFQVELRDLPTLVTECLALQQVFSNLISNAVKFTPQLDGKLTIRAINKNDYFEFTVKDNGIGIDPLYHERIFDIFQTLREKDQEESTGIGLSIVMKILEEHHETIRVESMVGHGAAFIFTWHNNR
jgi:signal transduction histidine kinase